MHKEASPPEAKRRQLKPVGRARNKTTSGVSRNSTATPVAATTTTNINVLPFEMLDLIFKFYFSPRDNRTELLSFARVNNLFKTVAYNTERLVVDLSSLDRFQFLINNFLMTKHNIKSLIIEDCIDEELITFIGNNMNKTLEEFTIFSGLGLSCKEVIVPAIEQLLPKLKNLRRLELLFLPLAQCLNMLANQENGNEQEPVLPKLEHLTSSWVSEIGENEASVSALPRIKTLTSLKLKTNRWCQTQNPVYLPPHLKHLNLDNFKASHINSMLMHNSIEVFNKLESLVIYCRDFDSADLNLLQHCSGTLRKLNLCVSDDTKAPVVAHEQEFLESLHQLKNLQELDLSIYAKEKWISCNWLASLFASISQLRVLKLCLSRQLFRQNIDVFHQSIATKLKQLHILSISLYYEDEFQSFIPAVARMYNLRVLELIRSSIPDEHIESLIGSLNSLKNFKLLKIESASEKQYKKIHQHILPTKCVIVESVTKWE